MNIAVTHSSFASKDVVQQPACEDALDGVEESVDNIFTLIDFSNEIKLAFCKQLDCRSIVNLQMTCTTFNTFLKDTEAIWKNIFSREHNGYLPKLAPVHWHSFYVEQQTVYKNIKNGASSAPITPLLTGCLSWGTFTYKDTYFVLQGFNTLACYNLTTGENVKNFTHIPKTAFVTELDEDVDLSPISIKPISSDLFLVTGKLLSIWNAATASCIFACEYYPYTSAYVDGSRVVFHKSADTVEVLDFISKKRLTTFSAAYEDWEAKFCAVGNAVFSLSWNCILSCFDFKQSKPLFNEVRFKELTDRTDSEFFCTPSHLVAVTVQRKSPFRTVVLGISLQNMDSAQMPVTFVKDLVRPKCVFAGLDDPKEIAVVHGEYLFGIIANNRNAVTCWELDTGAINKSFSSPEDEIWTFTIADCGRVIATVYEAPNQFRFMIWDVHNAATPLLEVQSESYDYKIHGHLLCIREVQQFRFIDIIAAREVGVIPFTAFTQKPICKEVSRQHWAFDGSRIHIQQEQPGNYYYWVVNINSKGPLRLQD